jgi:hypothetical protein
MLFLQHYLYFGYKLHVLGVSMFVVEVKKIYVQLRALGVVRLTREFSTQILGQGEDYYRHCCRTDRRDAVPRWVAARLISSLRMLHDTVASAVAPQIDKILADAEAADQIARVYYRR